MKRIILAGTDYCAVCEDGKLVEYHYMPEEERYGDIVLGRIDRIMPGMNCAFVNIGRSKNGFLPLYETSESFSGNKIRSGDMQILQIKKEGHEKKGAYLTRDITLPGSLVILMPMNRYIGVSSRIVDDHEREHMKEIGRHITDGRYGLILRYAAKDATEEKIRTEAEQLQELWTQILELSGQDSKPGEILYHSDPVERLKEDYTPRGLDEVRRMDIPDPEMIKQLRFSAERKLSLPGGGNIVIDRCEAMTVIDVNTSAANDGNKALTVLRTNLEACCLIAQQVRLRNLSGIILIDFIDMDTETDRNEVRTELEACFEKDRIKTVIHGWTKLGLMEMTRKRTRQDITEWTEKIY